MAGETSTARAGGRRRNVVYIVLDDMGFASTGAYGNDVIDTPNIDRLASEGLRYNNFHTTAMCSATRATLLTGADHHRVGVASLVDWRTGEANGIGHIDHRFATTAEILREEGYATFAVGKWHLSYFQTPAGPFDDWPLGRGFDRFYGVLPGMGDQYHPMLVQDNGFVGQPKAVGEGYHFSEDIVDHAIDFVSTSVTAYPERPFFLYAAFAATHTPFQAPRPFIERYRGAFHEGWDVLRKRWYENEKRLGVIPADAELTPRNELVPAWDDLRDDERAFAERSMEAFAGFLTHTDEQIGRLLGYLGDVGLLDDTLVVLLSDNGASGEGGRDGRFDSLRYNGGTADDGIDEPELAHGIAHLDEVGGEFSHVHYAAGWANALNCPFPWYKVLTFEGGVKDDLIVRLPAAIPDPGAVRGQYVHVGDVTPTVLDVLGIERPGEVRGVPQLPIDGTSFAPTLADGGAPEVRDLQVYEMLGNRAIYSHGWKAVVNHLVNGPDFSKDRWELYHVAEDYSEVHDVAGLYPAKLRELEGEFLLEAGDKGIFPLLAGKPDELVEGCGVERIEGEPLRARFGTLTGPFRIPRAPRELTGRDEIDVDGASHSFRAVVSIEAGDEGVVVSHGNRFGGFALFVQDGRLRYAYNENRIAFFEAASDELPAGRVEVGYDLRMRPGGRAADVTLSVDGRAVARTEIEGLYGLIIGAVELGANSYTEVSPRYASPFVFTGRIESAEFTQDERRAGFRGAWLADLMRAD